MISLPRETNDQGFKNVLGNRDLFALFLKDFVHIGILDNVRPEDIEDMTERYIAMGFGQRDSDTVKRINIEGQEPVFVVGLIEHQQEVDFRMAFRILQYMVLIWNDFEKEQDAINKGAAKRKGFKYPPVLPIVYYTGEDTWTSQTNYFDKVYLNCVFEPYIPKFEYLLLEADDYTKDDLLKNKNILALFLLIDKLRSADDISMLEDIPDEFFKEVQSKTPRHLIDLIGEVIEVFLAKLEVPRDQRRNFREIALEGSLAEMFDQFESYSVRKTLDRGREEGRVEGIEQGIEKVVKNMLLEEINIDIIIKISELPLDQIMSIKEELKRLGKIK